MGSYRDYTDGKKLNKMKSEKFLDYLENALDQKLHIWKN